jgi:hypothetical protein
MCFQAHADRVRSIHFMSDSCLITGSNRGVVKRWDISGKDEDVSKVKKAGASRLIKSSAPIAKEVTLNLSSAPAAESSAPVEIISNDLDISKEPEIQQNRRPTRFLDYYFRDAIAQKTSDQSKDTANKGTSSAADSRSQQQTITVKQQAITSNSSSSAIPVKQVPISTLDIPLRVVDSNLDDAVVAAAVAADPSPKDLRVKVCLFLSLDCISCVEFYANLYVVLPRCIYEGH